MTRNPFLIATAVFVALTAHAGGQVATKPETTIVAKPGPIDAILEARTNAVAEQLRCPVCRGVSIRDSPADLAQQMRILIKDDLRAGKTPDEIKAYFVSKYGESILLTPKASGFNLVVYALPMLAVLGGLAVVVIAMRRWTTKPPEEPSS